MSQILSIVSLFGAVASWQPQQPARMSPETPNDQVTLHFAPPDARRPLAYELAHGLPVFRVRLNGQDVWATIDDRITGSIISADFVKSNELKSTGVIGQAVTPTGTLERRAVRGVPVDVPGQMYWDANLSVEDLAFFNKVVGRPISLILGKEIFDNLEFAITAGDRHIQIGPSGTLNLPPTTPAISLINDRPQVAGVIDGQPVTLTIDLGYEGDIILSRDAWARLHMDERPATQGRSAHPDGNIEITRMAKVETVSLGSVEFHDVGLQTQSTFPDDRDGLIGFGLLSRYNFVIDIKARRLWFVSKVAPAQPAPAA